MVEQLKKMADRPLHELLSREMVDIYVGPDNTHWVLHEKLLCARSSFFRKVFSDTSSSPGSNKSFGLTDDDDTAFRAFVGWLYSGVVPPPHQEGDLGVSFDLYLMAERWGIDSLRKDVLDVVKSWYRNSGTYPGLRRVQYVYANTEEGSEMRGLLVGCVARMLVLGRNGLPKHWDKALRKNGQLAVDIITMVQKWNLDETSVPDVRGAELEENSPQLDTVAKGLEGATETNKQLLNKELPTGLVEGLTNEVQVKTSPRLPNGHSSGLSNGLTNGVAVH